MIYKIYEKQNLNSIREHSHIYEGNLSNAKRFATRNQAFYGTVLVIEERGHVVSYKKGGKWFDTDLFLEAQEEYNKRKLTFC